MKWVAKFVRTWNLPILLQPPQPPFPTIKIVREVSQISDEHIKYYF